MFLNSIDPFENRTLGAMDGQAHRPRLAGGT
ncbi:uncharacterized protein METZ01_LOCUS387930, partial [marine metagenome]